MQLQALLVLVFTLFGGSHSFKLDFPTSSDYWVGCGFNVFRWTAEANDPAIFSVVMQNTNKSVLNDDLSIANSLQSKQGAAQVFVPCVKADGDYQIHLINATHYSHKNPKASIYLSSPTFAIKPNGTTPSPNSGQTSIPTSEDEAFASVSTNTSLSLPATLRGGSPTSPSSTTETGAGAAGAAPQPNPTASVPNPSAANTNTAAGGAANAGASRPATDKPAKNAADVLALPGFAAWIVVGSLAFAGGCALL